MGDATWPAGAAPANGQVTSSLPRPRRGTQIRQTGIEIAARASAASSHADRRSHDSRILIQSDVESAWLEARPPLEVGQPRARGRQEQTAGQRTGHGNLSIGRTGARGRRWDQCWGAGEEKDRGSECWLSLWPWYGVCKRVDVGCRLLPPERDGRPCPIRSGTRWGWPVARGSVCQMQVVSNHRSGVAARKPPLQALLGISHAGYRQGPPGHP